MAVTPWATEATYDRLAALGELPKRSPFQNYGNDAIDTALHRKITQQLMRITGTVATRSDFQGKVGGGERLLWNETLFGLAAEVGASVHIYLYGPLEMQVPKPDDHMDAWQGRWGHELETLHEDLLSIKAAADAAGLQVAFVSEGQERINVTEYNHDNLVGFHDANYAIVKGIFPEAMFIRYSDCNLAPNLGPDGWQRRPLYPMAMKRDCISCDCYYPDWVSLREQLRRAAQMAWELGVPLVPYTCLGRRYYWDILDPPHENEHAAFTLETCTPIAWQYFGRAVYAENTAWVAAHGVPLLQRKYDDYVRNGAGTGRIFAGDIPCCFVWPGAFDHRADADYFLCDLEALCKGAHAFTRKEAVRVPTVKYWWETGGPRNVVSLMMDVDGTAVNLGVWPTVAEAMEYLAGLRNSMRRCGVLHDVVL